MSSTAKVTRIVFKSAGFRAIATSPRVQADLMRRGRAIASRAGDGFEAIEAGGVTRARVLVVANTRAARRAEATSKALTSALGAGRG